MTRITVNVAADILNVSEKYVYNLISWKKLPFNHITQHLYLDDVLKHKKQMDAFRELVRLTEEYGGYDDE